MNSTNGIYLDDFLFDISTEMMIFQCNMFCSQSEFVRFCDSYCAAIIVEYLAVDLRFRHVDVEDTADLDDEIHRIT